MTETKNAASLAERLQAFVGKPYGGPSVGRDPVNVPMIRHLTDALGDRNPVYTDEAFAERSIHGGIVAPATSLQVWTMPGLAPRPSQADASNPQAQLMSMVDAEGYVGVVATNCEQVYHRYLRPGDLLTVSSEVESIVGPKQTGLGEGYFITTLQTYRDQSGEVVGEMRFRILKFKPATGGARSAAASGSPATGGARSAAASGSEATAVAGAREPKPVSPALDLPPPPMDSAFFWEGVASDELRIQRCASCGALRHPPRPMCPACRSLEHDHVVSSGRGEVYSFVVHHRPEVPGREHPFAVVLVALEEGTRIVGNTVDIDPSEVRIGLPVEVTFEPNAQGRKLARWRPASVREPSEPERRDGR